MKGPDAAENQIDISESLVSIRGQGQNRLAQSDH